MEYIGSELEVAQYAKNWKKYFSSKIHKYIKGDVLEVGAGIGANTRYLSAGREQFINSWTALEPDPKLVVELANALKDFGAEIVEGTIDAMGSKKFDTIIYIDVLEHIDESKEEIIKIKSRLKIGGNLIILVPAYNFLYSDFDKNIGHFRRYNKSILRNEVNDSLKFEKLFYLDSMGFLASLFNKLFLNQGQLTKGNIDLWDKVLVPFSRIIDVFTLKSFGKSLIAVLNKKD